jgi:mono/diheme cytochrome c family protein
MRLIALALVLLPASFAQPALESGKDIYRSACAACHGANGKGAEQTTVGFRLPLPDFTDCNFAAREPDSDWIAITHRGGPARGFSTIMPAFEEALTREQIEKVVEYIRGFCREPPWPRGDLNLPRALVTEMAFVEDEAVITTAIGAEDGAAVQSRIVYEKRFGARNNFEAVIPVGFQRPTGAHWRGGIGDLTLGVKRTLLANLRTGSIFAASGEVTLATGNQARGFGKGVTIFEPFVAFGQMLPSDSFLQFQSGVEIPTHEDDAGREFFWRGTVGRTFAQGGGLGRAWSPMVEFLAARELETGARTEWDVLPQFQVTLSRRQHIMANFGVRVPAVNRGSRPVQFVFYLLWDWFDGGLRDGW